MGIQQLIDRFGQWLDESILHRPGRRAQLDELIKRLEHREDTLERRLAHEENPARRRRLLLELNVTRLQHRKGLARRRTVAGCAETDAVSDAPVLHRHASS